jgi:hypothetical protein
VVVVVVMGGGGGGVSNGWREWHILLAYEMQAAALAAREYPMHGSIAVLQYNSVLLASPSSIPAQDPAPSTTTRETTTANAASTVLTTRASMWVFNGKTAVQPVAYKFIRFGLEGTPTT